MLRQGPVVCVEWAIRPTPFHEGTNNCHHAKSDLNSLLSLTWGETRPRPERRSIILLRKDRPGHTTLQAWFRRPTRDCNLLSLQILRSPQLSRVASKCCSFSAGRRSVPATESTSMPRKTMWVAGPAHLSIARGTPNFSHVCCSIQRSSWHCLESAGPSTIRSSR